MGSRNGFFGAAAVAANSGARFDRMISIRSESLQSVTRVPVDWDALPVNFGETTFASLRLYQRHLFGPNEHTHSVTCRS
jgi:hypothetical protein